MSSHSICTAPRLLNLISIHSRVQTHTKARVGGDDEGHGRSEAARRPHVVEQGPERDGAGVAHAVPWVVPVHVAGGLLGLVHLRVPPHRVLHGARLGRGGVPGGALHGQRRRRGGWPAAVRVRRAGALRGGGGELVVEHAGAGRARDRVGAPAARAVQPAGVRAGRGDAAVARAEPRRAHGVPGREPLLRGAPGREAPGAGGLRRGLRHGGARAPGPPRRRPRRARRRVPPRPEPALLRVPPRHQRPPQPALRRRLGRHPRRRPARVRASAHATIAMHVGCRVVHGFLGLNH